MKNRRALWILTAMALTLTATTVSARAQDAANVQRTLDRQVSISETDALIGEVFERLSGHSGVKFILDAETFACLPYGDQTRITVIVKNVTLRNALTPMLAPQALRWVVDGQTVRILPSDALARMCRRASYEELQLLGRIHTAELTPATSHEAVLGQLGKVAGDRPLDMDFRVDGDVDAALAGAGRALPGTGAEWLDMLCRRRGWTWYLWGDDIVVLSRKDQFDRQLQRQVSIEYRNEDLVKVLLDLLAKARVPLSMDPGVLNYVPAETRHNLNLSMTDATIAQALEVVSGATGLVFVRTDEGLRAEASEALKARPARMGAGQRQRQPFFVRFSIPAAAGASIEVFMRADELPEEVIEQIKAQKAKLIEEFRRGATSRPAE